MKLRKLLSIIAKIKQEVKFLSDHLNNEIFNKKY